MFSRSRFLPRGSDEFVIPFDIVAGLVPPMVRYKCCAFLTLWQDWFLPWSDISAKEVKTYVEDRPTSSKAGSVEIPMTSRIER